MDLTIAHATLDGTPAMVSVDGSNGSKPGIDIGGAYYLVRHPLSATASTSITLHRSGLADVSTNIIWRAIDLSAYSAMERAQLQVGDSLLLTAGSGQTGTLDIAIADCLRSKVYSEFVSVAGGLRSVVYSFPVMYSQIHY